MPRRGPAKNATLAEVGENAFIDSVSQWIGGREYLPVGDVLSQIGDDGALWEPPPGRQTLTTDMLVEGVHFFPDHPPYQLGLKAAEVNLSDLAAMGSQPVWALISLGLPPQTQMAWLQDFYKGFTKSLERVNARCLGGDTVRADHVTISVTAAGHLPENVSSPIRAKMKPGQTLYVTGPLGEAAGALDWLRRGKGNTPTGFPRLLKRLQSPRARVEAGMAIARFCPDAAMMDLSDGLGQDLPRMARESGCGFRLFQDKIPLSPALGRLALLLDREPLDYALWGGEDYELLFATAIKPERWQEEVEKSEKKPLKVRAIGIVEMGGDFLLEQGRKKTISLTSGGFQHFEGNN